MTQAKSSTETPNHALPRTQRERRDCNRYVPSSGSLGPAALG